ncbi:spore coat protein GerQ [Aeribacillus pallidus]|uniref:spore coat protein GerQ n=1 Tax=Aeribacillus pallidus TaxID=33936 RepID=UPI003D1B9211
MTQWYYPVQWSYPTQWYEQVRQNGGYPQQYYPQMFQQPTGSQLQVPQPLDAPSKSQPIPGMLPIEESYIENILRLNKGKLVKVYTTFENNQKWNAVIFKGLIEAAGRDHLILSDPETGKRYLIPMIYLDYVEFEEEIEYEYPFNSTMQMATYSPR